MLYNKIDTSKVKSEMNMDFEQIQKDLTKFKNHTSMPQDKKLYFPGSKTRRKSRYNRS